MKFAEILIRVLRIFSNFCYKIFKIFSIFSILVILFYLNVVELNFYIFNKVCKISFILYISKYVLQLAWPPTGFRLAPL